NQGVSVDTRAHGLCIEDVVRNSLGECTQIFAADQSTLDVANLNGHIASRGQFEVYAALVFERVGEVLHELDSVLVGHVFHFGHASGLEAYGTCNESVKVSPLGVFTADFVDEQGTVCTRRLKGHGHFGATTEVGY